MPDLRRVAVVDHGCFYRRALMLYDKSSILVYEDFVKRLSRGQFHLGEFCMIKVKVPELMEKKGWNVSDLMRKANVAYTTANRLYKGGGDSISFDVLNSLCEIFDVQVKDILEYVPDQNN